jgi:PleD family two-component response regulator
MAAALYAALLGRYERDRLERWHDGAMSAPTPPLRVMLVDDHQVVRDGIRLLLNQAEDVVVCAEASSAREAVAVAAQAGRGLSAAEASP